MKKKKGVKFILIIANMIFYLEIPRELTPKTL